MKRPYWTITFYTLVERAMNHEFEYGREVEARQKFGILKDIAQQNGAEISLTLSEHYPCNTCDGWGNWPIPETEYDETCWSCRGSGEYEIALEVY